MRVSANRWFTWGILGAWMILGRPTPAETRPFTIADLQRLRSVGEVEVSPDGARIAYSIQSSDGPGRPSSTLAILDLATGRSSGLGPDVESASGPRWSPDGRWIAFFARRSGETGVAVSRPDGSDFRWLAPVQGTNHPLPSAGERLAWSPDGRSIAFISATPGPEADANGDPMVITRYLYKPTASEGLTRFNDNRRLHVFVVNVASGTVRQLTTGDYYEHSIDWSPGGDEILFVSNREPDPDRFFNYDLFAVRVSDGSVRRITSTKSAEYRPRWSPDGRSIAFLGTTRDLTSSETTMEDTHVWVMSADGGGRRELGRLDNRQEPPQWAPDGSAVLTAVQERGSVRLYRFPVDGRPPAIVVPASPAPGRVGNWSIGGGGLLAYAFETTGDLAELFIAHGNRQPRAVTTLNAQLLAQVDLAPVESLVFRSDDGTEVEGFLTRPAAPDHTCPCPLIAMIKGGPHGQQGPTLNPKAQVYAAHGFAVLMVNYRGSTGYGQAFTDAIFGDQDGNEARDVLAGVDAALDRYSWLDRNRLGVEGGSYGGQLTNWLITQTDRFKAAIPTAGIANLVSFNYMAYYHDYLAVEFGLFPHEAWPAGKRPAAAGQAMNLMDFLWMRSPLRYAARVRTPTLFLHGENDNDVPIAEAEQFFIALRDAGVETVMVRYPREGHGLRETAHIVDSIERSLTWYDGHFDRTDAKRGADGVPGFR
jgi:dipeptidyl aminopeptidase/acylaminoacyl peptidase